MDSQRRWVFEAVYFYAMVACMPPNLVMICRRTRIPADQVCQLLKELIAEEEVFEKDGHYYTRLGYQPKDEQPKTKKKRPPEPPMPPIKFLTCEECGNEQPDMGRGVVCEQCGATMPEPEPEPDENAE